MNMKRGMKLCAAAFALFCLALGSFVLFFPWEASGRLGGILLRERLAPRGVSLSWRNIESSGMGNFRILDPGMALPMATLEMRECDLLPRWGESLRRFAGILDISFGPGELRVFGKSLSWSGGSGRIVCERGVVHIFSFRSAGEFRAQGDCSFSLETRRFLKASIAIRVPPEKDQLFAPLQGFLPLRKGEEPGQWFHERKEGTS